MLLNLKFRRSQILFGGCLDRADISQFFGCIWIFQNPKVEFWQSSSGCAVLGLFTPDYTVWIRLYLPLCLFMTRLVRVFVSTRTCVCLALCLSLSRLVCVCLDWCVCLSRLIREFVSTRVCVFVSTRACVCLASCVFVHLLDSQQEADREGHEDGDHPGQKGALARDGVLTVVAVVGARAPGYTRTLRFIFCICDSYYRSDSDHYV